MQNKAFEKTGFDARYELLQISKDQFASTMKEIQKNHDVLGFNITAPYKETILPYVSKLDSRSESIGAVNTVRISRTRKMNGYDTDVAGISASLSKLGARGKGKCVVLGAGGAARACIYTVLKSGFDPIIILNRSKKRAQKVRDHFKARFPKSRIQVRPLTARDFAKEIGNTDLLINAVTNPFPIEVDFSGARRDLKFLDLGYKEPSNILVKARKARIRSMDGLFMLVEQGAKSFEIWTGLKAPRKPMLLAAKRQLSRE
jgi:shikimate dehydrogenase